MTMGIGHVAYRVKDIKASLDFYGKLGLTDAFHLDRDGVLWIVYLKLDSGQFLELFPGATQPVPLTQDSIAYAHICLEVDDIKQVVADLESKGVVIDRPIKQGNDHNYQAWVVDPDGNRIELMQISPDSPQAKARQQA